MIRLPTQETDLERRGYLSLLDFYRGGNSNSIDLLIWSGNVHCIVSPLHVIESNILAAFLLDLWIVNAILTLRLYYY